MLISCSDQLFISISSSGRYCSTLSSSHTKTTAGSGLSHIQHFK